MVVTKVPEDLRAIREMPPETRQLALAGLLSAKFRAHGVTLTVVGGAAVQYYTLAEYTTKDLDAILFADSKEIVESVMHFLGFKRTSSYRHFEHPDLPFVVEFPPSPIAVGGRYIAEVNKLTFGEYEVRVIRIEDILMDRIIAGVEWRSPLHLEQAKLLWLKNRKIIDRKYLAEFAISEGYTRELKRVMKQRSPRPITGKGAKR